MLAAILLFSLRREIEISNIGRGGIFLTMYATAMMGDSYMSMRNRINELGETVRAYH